MIALFPSYIRRFLILSGVLIGALLLLFFLVPGTNPIVIAIVGVLGVLLFLISQATEANKAHIQLVNILYEQLDTERFLRSYEPLLSKKVRNPNVELTLRLHLSNAYTATGEYAKAEQTLLDASPLTGKNPEKGLLSRFAVISNLCFCKEQEQKTDEAGVYLQQLLDIKKQLEQIQQTKPEKKRLTFNTSFNETCYAFLKDGVANPNALHDLVQKNTTQLERISISLWTARMYIKDNRISEARELLERIVKVGSHLSYGRQAKTLLDSITV
ncbi:MAG: hypothetical protein IJT77_12615 [Clostridia bacterium]|nr:hypothetical protein [Clostridia bacterium]